MALSKFSPDPEKAEELARKLKSILDTILLRDPSLNEREIEESIRIFKELEKMGFHVSVKYKLMLNLNDPLNSKVDTEVALFLPKVTTIR